MKNPLADLSWLFFTPKVFNKGLSSGARFKPTNALLSKNAWQSTTSPSTSQNKKSIVITKESFGEHSVDLYALAEWLRRDGFTIYLCVAEEEKGKIFKLYEGSATDIKKLSQLSALDEERESEALAKHVAQDQVVILDSIKAEAIKKCFLEITHCPDASSNAISTATTLRFHSHPQTADGIKQLLVNLRAAISDDEKKVAFQKYGNLKGIFDTKNSNDIKNILTVYPPAFDILWDDYDPKGLDSLVNLESIYLKVYPSEAARVWGKYKQKINTLTDVKLVHWLELWPEGRQEIWNYFKTDKTNPLSNGQFAGVLKAWPQGAQGVWDHFILINSDSLPDNLADILSAWPQGAQGVWDHFILINSDSLPDNLADILSAWPQGAQGVWDYFKAQKITISAGQLASILEKWPQGAQEVWDYFKAQKINISAENLAPILSAWPTGAHEVWDYCKAKEITVLARQLVPILENWPEGAQEVWDYFKPKKITVSARQVAFIMKKWPQGAQQVWDYFKVKNENAPPASEIHKIFLCWPEGAQQVWDYFKVKNENALPTSDLHKIFLRWPEGAQEVWDYFKAQKNNVAVNEIASILKDWPAGAQRAWDHFKENTKECLNPKLLSECLAAWPEGAFQLLKFHHENLSSQNFLDHLIYWPTGASILWAYYTQYCTFDLEIVQLSQLLKQWPAGEQKIIDYCNEKKYKFSLDLLTVGVKESRYNHFLFSIKAWPEDIEKIIYNSLEIFMEDPKLLVGFLEKNLIVAQRVFYHLSQQNDSRLDDLYMTLRENNFLFFERYCSLQSCPEKYSKYLTDSRPALQPGIEQRITCLYLGSMDQNVINEAKIFIEHHPLDNLSAIEIANCSENQITDLYSFLMTFASMGPLQIFLPKSFEHDIKLNLTDLPSNLYYHYSQEKITLPLKSQSHAAVVPNQTVFHNLILSGESKQVPKFPSSTLFIANNSLGNTFDPVDSNYSYEMIPAGEFLNSDGSQLEVRTGIVDINFDDLSQNYVVPEKFDVVKPTLYAKKEYKDFVDNCKTRGISNGRYVQFHQTLSARQRIRLLSIDAAEVCEGVYSEPLSLIKMERGSDGFYYATATNKCVLHYVLKAESQKKLEAAYQSIPYQDPIKSIIEFFQKKSSTSDPNKPIPYTQTGQLDWKALYEEGMGSCRHRVAAVYKKITESFPLQKRNIRMVDINHNHMCLELNYKGKFFQIDFGGSPADLSYTNTNTAYHAPPDPESAQKDFLGVDTYNSQGFFKIHYQENYFQIPSDQTDQKFSQTRQSVQQITPLSISVESTPAILDVHKKYSLVPMQNQLAIINDEQMLCEKTFSASAKRVLVTTGTTEKLEAQANFLIQKARENGRAVFYLDDPSVLDIGEEHLWIDEKGCPQIGVYSLLSEFLKNNDESALLLVNWEAFGPKQRLQLNKMLENDCYIRGQKVTTPPKIVSSCHQMPKDGSFTSRHSLLLNTKAVVISIDKKDKPEIKQDLSIISIDLQGYTDWKEALFGKIIQTSRGAEWQKTEFVHILENNKNVTININNASDPTALNFLLKQAQALGHFSYHGYQIPNNTAHIVCNTLPFNFKEFKTITIEKDITSEKVSVTTPIVDTHVFDTLISGKHIHANCYNEIEGLIEQHSGRALVLFITSTLTDAQYYCLCVLAKKHDVTLTLQLAPDVALPKDFATKIQQSTFSETLEEKSAPRIYITSNPDNQENTLCSSARLKPLVLHVEDYTFSDLIFDIHYDKTPSGFENFRLLESDVLRELEKGRDVILRGEFSDALLSELKPLLLGRNLRLPNGREVIIRGHLRLIVEPKNNLNLKWLSPNAIYVDHEKQKSKLKEPPIILYEEDSALNSTVDLSHSENQADNFIKNRKEQFLKALENPARPMIQLVGESGVGKSHLLSDLEADGMCNVHHELPSIASWAQDTKPGLKILFIDEANIEDKHLTLFSSLKKGADGAEILYKGKLHTLTKEHRVVFARNPHHYGGGRVMQRLFQDNLVPEVHFTDFPDTYIYERILKPILKLTAKGVPNAAYYNARFFSPALTAIWKQDAQKRIQKYKQRENRDTVRELQEEVLQDVQIQKAVGDRYMTPFGGTATPEQSKLIQSAKAFIQVRKNRRDQKALSSNGLGLNGYLLEGKPATGKSEIVGYALKAMGYKETSEENKQEEGHYYYSRIDANLSLEQKKTLILKAFDEGNAIWIDEINSCMDDGLEKILNAVLTGRHPDTKKPAKKAGFMAFFTANSAMLEGRDLIGPAVRHRCLQKKTQDYAEKNLISIFKKEFPDKSAEDNEAMASEFFKLQQEKNLDLRGYLELRKQMLINTTNTVQMHISSTTDIPVLESKAPARL